MHLYRYYACGPDGDDATTLAIVSASSDDDAMRKGEQQFPREALAGYCKAYGISPEGDEDVSPFLTCEQLKARFAEQGRTRDEQIDDAVYVLHSMPGLIGLPDTVLEGLGVALVNATMGEA